MLNRDTDIFQVRFMALRASISEVLKFYILPWLDQVAKNQRNQSLHDILVLLCGNKNLLIEGIYCIIKIPNFTFFFGNLHNLSDT